ncbi:MAG TPA: DUF448 domain-containing protein [Polyangiaceae bacterium]
MNASTQPRPERSLEDRASTRTCVGCGVRDDKASMMRFVVEGGEIVFHPTFQAGRGAHLHPRPECVRGAPKGLGRAFKGEARVGATEIGERLAESCERRMVGLLLAARRRGDLAIGAEAGGRALRAGAPLVVVAVDAGSVRKTTEVEGAIASGRAIAWKTKSELGALLGEEAIAICVVSHRGIATELQSMRAAIDAGRTPAAEGAECSKVREAR